MHFAAISARICISFVRSVRKREIWSGSSLSERSCCVWHPRDTIGLCRRKATAQPTAADFDWDKIFDGADRFHFTGITPALGDNVAAICLEAVKAAKARGITVSCDLNYRKKLWTKQKAGEVMGELCRYVDVCIANEEDAADVFGISAADTDVSKGEVNHEGYKDVARQLMERFGFQYVAITLRTSISANDND